MKSESETISLRLEPELLRKLDKQRAPFGDSRGQCVKRMVTATLLGSRDEELLQAMTEVRLSQERSQDDRSQEAETMQRAIRRLAFFILTHDGPVDAQNAKKIARGLFSDPENL